MDWHKRFQQQAGWTNDLRTYLFKLAGMESAGRVLEVGCGTGAILATLASGPGIHGLDLQPDRLVEARQHAPQAILTCGDACCLPFASGVFDITFCHFLLLWVPDPLQALLEMKRLTRPGGSILALSEPDYTARVDKPDSLAALGYWQSESLRRQGADPGLGRRLAELFHLAGIPLIETGCLEPEARHLPSYGEWKLEWTVMEEDLADLLPLKEIQRLKRLDKTAWQRRERVLHVPTYWAYGNSS
jgi:SAM-dependent methyltransferase